MPLEGHSDRWAVPGLMICRQTPSVARLKSLVIYSLDYHAYESLELIVVLLFVRDYHDTMLGNNFTNPFLKKWLTWIFVIPLFTSLIAPAIAQETFTNAACRAVTTQMNSCAKRWDSVRTECTNQVTTNTVWPGPCECAYFANDLPCFDEKEFCAAQVWTQVPQWFRDGVTSCLMKDAAFTVRAQLGSDIGRMGNPFTVQGLAGNATVTATGTAMPTSARAGASVPLPTATSTDQSDTSDRLSTGAKAGFGVGIGVVVILIIAMAILLVRRRKKPAQETDDEKKWQGSLAELQDPDSHVHQISSKSIYPNHEMLGSLALRHELAVRTSTFIVELPHDISNRNSMRRM
ncbi:hypothetical protein BKA66DRAFT_475813 [Pyrenochaeta sp. MPI-SDFR-AT-0127]|nr:hypothetical protein BKA66DRAFT_475813 [Pyrenochaeta sp. MPI-SDFR-AT-0127]